MVLELLTVDQNSNERTDERTQAPFNIDKITCQKLSKATEIPETLKVTMKAAYRPKYLTV